MKEKNGKTVYIKIQWRLALAKFDELLVSIPVERVAVSSLDGGTAKMAGMLNVLPGHAVSYCIFKLSSSHVQVVNADRSSLSNTKSDRSSLNATHISSVGGGVGSTLNSANVCSSALAFFCPTLAGNFIFKERSDTPVPRKSLNLIPALSTAYKKMIFN